MTLSEVALSKPTAQEAIGLLADQIEQLKHDVVALQKEDKATWDTWEPNEDEPTHQQTHIESALAEARQGLAEATDVDDHRALTAKIQLLEDELKGRSVPPPEEGQRTNQIVSEDGDVVVEVPKVTPEKEMERMVFANDVLKLPEVYPEEGESFVASYGTAGPLLLYYTDRDFVVSLPEGYKRIMVEDVLETAPQEAHEFARDVLKADSEGPDFG